MVVTLRTISGETIYLNTASIDAIIDDGSNKNLSVFINEHLFRVMINESDKETLLKAYGATETKTRKVALK